MKPKGTQFDYDAPEMGREYHRIRASENGEPRGFMNWDSRGIRSIEVADDYQRQGIGTAMWNEGHRLAGEQSRVPAPTHSPDRTDAGDAWARSVGGRLPRRTQ